MLCDECGRNESTVHIVQIGPEGRQERNLCAHCAARHGEWITEPLKQHKNMSLNEFLQSIFRSVQEASSEEGDGGDLPDCPECGMSYAQFQSSGRMGCPGCYRAFQPKLEPLVRRIQGASVHRGKIPYRTGRAQEIQQELLGLRTRLQRAIEEEAYEQAAVYRDRLRELERQAWKEGEHGHEE